MERDEDDDFLPNDDGAKASQTFAVDASVTKKEPTKNFIANAVLLSICGSFQRCFLNPS